MKIQPYRFPRTVVVFNRYSIVIFEPTLRMDSLRNPIALELLVLNFDSYFNNPNTFSCLTYLSM